MKTEMEASRRESWIGAIVLILIEPAQMSRLGLPKLSNL